jgi:hypothetical protein
MAGIERPFGRIASSFISNPAALADRGLCLARACHVHRLEPLHLEAQHEMPRMHHGDYEMDGAVR